VASVLVGVDHRRTDLCQFAFGRGGPDLVEELGRDQLEDGVAEVLEPFVVAAIEARVLVRIGAVRERLFEQRRITERDTDLLLELVEPVGRDRGSL